MLYEVITEYYTQQAYKNKELTLKNYVSMATKSVQTIYDDYKNGEISEADALHYKTDVYTNLARITSYNVCYTKLLRYVLMIKQLL